MSGRRRVQRSVRVVAAAGLLCVAGLAVLVSVLVGVAVSAAAFGAAGAGALSARIIYSEVTQTRRGAACERTEQSRSFGAVMTRVHREHRAFTASMTARLAQRDQTIQQCDKTIGDLRDTLLSAERRIGTAEGRVVHEARRADEAQQRLSALLDEVLTKPVLHAVDDERKEPSTIVDLLAWEERASVAAEASRQRAAARKQG